MDLKIKIIKKVLLLFFIIISTENSIFSKPKLALDNMVSCYLEDVGDHYSLTKNQCLSLENKEGQNNENDAAGKKNNKNSGKVNKESEDETLEDETLEDEEGTTILSQTRIQGNKQLRAEHERRVKELHNTYCKEEDKDCDPYDSKLFKEEFLNKFLNYEAYSLITFDFSKFVITQSFGIKLIFLKLNIQKMSSNNYQVVISASTYYEPGEFKSILPFLEKDKKYDYGFEKFFYPIFKESVIFECSNSEDCFLYSESKDYIDNFIIEVPTDLLQINREVLKKFFQPTYEKKKNIYTGIFKSISRNSNFLEIFKKKLKEDIVFWAPRFTAFALILKGGKALPALDEVVNTIAQIFGKEKKFIAIDPTHLDLDLFPIYYIDEDKTKENRNKYHLKMYPLEELKNVMKKKFRLID